MLNTFTTSPCSTVTATTDRDKQMAVSEFPPFTGRPFNPADDVLQFLPVNQTQSSVNNLEMIN